MKNFKLDENGDILINNNEIDIISDTEYMYQKIKTILSTNQKEWQLNRNEGINFRNIITKNYDEDIIRNEILNGLKQVDKNFSLQSFEMSVDKNRIANIKFVAQLGTDLFAIEQSY